MVEKRTDPNLIAAFEERQAQELKSDETSIFDLQKTLKELKKKDTNDDTIQRRIEVVEEILNEKLQKRIKLMSEHVRLYNEGKDKNASRISEIIIEIAKLNGNYTEEHEELDESTQKTFTEEGLEKREKFLRTMTLDQLNVTREFHKTCGAKPNDPIIRLIEKVIAEKEPQE